MRNRNIIGILFLLIPILQPACGEEAIGPEGLESLNIYTWGPAVVLPGTPVSFEGEGFILPQLGEMTVHLDGHCGEQHIGYNSVLEYLDDNNAVWTVPPDFAKAVSVYKTPFKGKIRITRKVFGYPGTNSIEIAASLDVQRILKPVLQNIEPVGAYVGDELQVHGEGLLTVGEGKTVLFLSGQFTVQSPPMVKDFQNVVIPISVENRKRGLFSLAPDKFGVYPGLFEGTGSLVNDVDDGETEPENSEVVSELSIRIYRPVVKNFSPDVVRRGQKVEVTGQGFVATDPVGETATLLLLEGVFDTTSGKQLSFQGNDAMLLFPEFFEGNTFLEVVLRVTPGVDGELTGLGLIPGVFTGTVYPHLFYGGESFIGDGLDFVLTVAPQLQVVFIKYLPSFGESLNEFGMYEVRELVKDHVLERCNRDYSAFNVTYSESRPTDFVEYSIIEVSGEDPNGANLLGLDNTTGKDINNLRFNDVVGGKNAETEEQGYYAYGGVFVQSFLMFSPAISQGQTSLASTRFDDIFSPFVPQLGGTPIEAGEYPGGDRSILIEEAVRALGNLVGGTLAHEIGHSLGLAMVPGHPEEYHNLGDNPKWLMDAGNYRPFEERAEIDGQGPEVFAPYNYEYLNKILPKG